mmetsp:Transcript_9673/g.23888  ORF Transcript_9673/g.23888 Transcript_9673/m.23888 type:complete len:200 (+) Transcript_9673:1917-2516(+)
MRSQLVLVRERPAVLRVAPPRREIMPQTIVLPPQLSDMAREHPVRIGNAPLQKLAQRPRVQDAERPPKLQLVLGTVMRLRLLQLSKLCVHVNGGAAVESRVHCSVAVHHPEETCPEGIVDAVLAPRARRVCLDDEAIEERMQVQIRADDPADPEPVAKMLAALAVGDLILHHHLFSSVVADVEFYFFKTPNHHDKAPRD